MLQFSKSTDDALHDLIRLDFLRDAAMSGVRNDLARLAYQSSRQYRLLSKQNDAFKHCSAIMQ